MPRHGARPRWIRTRQTQQPQGGSVIYELRTYTLIPGTQAKYLQLNRDIGRGIRGDEYGKLEGAWTTELGKLNQYVHLWSYADLNERDRLRLELAQNERWTKEYVPQIRPLMVAQENKILAAVDGVPLSPPGGDGHVYELRSYPMHVGKLSEWVGLFRGALSTRQKYSKIVGLWTTEVGALNQALHLWAYDDLNHRADVRARASHDPDWQAYLAKVTPLLAEQHAVILTPTTVSPLR